MPGSLTLRSRLSGGRGGKPCLRQLLLNVADDVLGVRLQLLRVAREVALGALHLPLDLPAVTPEEASGLVAPLAQLALRTAAGGVPAALEALEVRVHPALKALHLTRGRVDAPRVRADGVHQGVARDQ